jgi:hypothetical protein
MKHKCLVIIGAVIVCLCSCKKDSKAPGNGTLIVGKWFYVKQVSVLYQNNKQISASDITDFTKDDFVEYYNDGSGYSSSASSVGPSLEEFKYKLNGSTLTQYTSVENSGMPETITNISSTALSIHVVLQVPDPNDPSITDTEVDDLTFTI